MCPERLFHPCRFGWFSSTRSHSVPRPLLVRSRRGLVRGLYVTLNHYTLGVWKVNEEFCQGKIPKSSPSFFGRPPCHDRENRWLDRPHWKGLGRDGRCWIFEFGRLGFGAPLDAFTFSYTPRYPLPQSERGDHKLPIQTCTVEWKGQEWTYYPVVSDEVPQLPLLSGCRHTRTVHWTQVVSIHSRDSP